MKRINIGLLLVLLLAACTSATNIDDTVLDSIRSDYRSWTRVNPEPLKIPDWLAALCTMPPIDQQARLDSPHSDEYSNVYVNPTGSTAMMLIGERVFPVGTIIVKEKLLKIDDNIAEALGLMIKHEKGYNPKGGDWEYAYWQTSGKIQRSVETAQQCQSCHIGSSKEMRAQYSDLSEWGAGRQARDSVFSGFTDTSNP